MQPGPAALLGEAGPALAWLGGAAVAALLAVAALVRRGPRRIPRRARALLDAIPGALGDAVIVVDGAGRIAAVDDAAARLAGTAPERLLGRPAAAALGADVGVLLRGLGHGPSSARVRVATEAGALPARAAAVRIARRPSLDVLVLRPEPAPPPPAQPPPLPRPERAGPYDAAVAAVERALRDPLARAATAASLLRLALPARDALAAREIDRLEHALAEAERRLAALAPAAPPRRSAVDVTALVSEVLRTLELPLGIRVHHPRAPGIVLADEPRLRRALAVVLREAAAAMPRGGELAIGLVRRGADLVVEVSDTGARADAAGLLVARALLFDQGGRLEQEPVPGRGTVCRIALPAARPPPAV